MPRELMSTSTRPQPVVAAANVAAVVNGLVAALGTVAVVVGIMTQTDADTIVEAVTAVVGAIVTLVTVVTPIVQAMKARDVVTPLSDPRDSSGVALVPAVDPSQVVLPTPAEVKDEVAGNDSPPGA